MEAITITESKRLISLEEVVAHGQQTFVEVGNALAEIRDARLYRSEFKTFEDYCREKWGWEKAYCNHLVRAAETVKSLPPNVATMVATERQARALAKVEPEHRAEVIERASEQGPLTAKSIREAGEKWEIGGNVTVPRDDAPEDHESDTLWNLKRLWKKATKSEKKQFKQFIET